MNPSALAQVYPDCPELPLTLCVWARVCRFGSKTWTRWRPARRLAQRTDAGPLVAAIPAGVSGQVSAHAGGRAARTQPPGVMPDGSVGGPRVGVYPLR